MNKTPYQRAIKVEVTNLRSALNVSGSPEEKMPILEDAANMLFRLVDRHLAQFYVLDASTEDQADSKRHCLTCKWEPVWTFWIPTQQDVCGACRGGFPITETHVYRPNIKSNVCKWDGIEIDNCPAWTGK